MSDDPKGASLKPVEMEIVADRFVLRDNKGRRRAVLQMSPCDEGESDCDSSPCFYLLDENEEGVIAILGDSDGPTILMLQRSLERSIQISVGERAEVRVRNANYAVQVFPPRPEEPF